jgi:tRNA A37 methylthiotransferase MiaB
MKNINVVFYSPSIDQARSNKLTHQDLMVNPTPYYLHGYFKKHYPEQAKHVKWKPSILVKKSTQDLVAFLNKHQADVLCVSLYVWNVSQSMDMLALVKEQYARPLKIVVGGPSCDAVKDEWETQYSFVDHFVVGQGEKAWANLALDFLGVQVLDTDSPNIVHFLRKGETAPVKKYEYEFVRGIHYSPYMECEDLIHDLQAEYHDIGLTWPYETQRGCPYHCSFCDWNGGQSNKTQKRKEINFVDEIDFFAKNKMYKVYISDANFGMWDVDVEIMKRLVQHKLEGHDFKFITVNMNKIVNQNFKEIMHMIVQYDFSGWIKLSVQDIQPNVLTAINRPGDWNEIKQAGLELYQAFSKSKNLNKIFVELILGLPEQTVESFTATLNEVHRNGFLTRTYPFLLLRNAPANYDLEYRAKYGIRDALVYELLDTVADGNNVKEIAERPMTNLIYNQVVECNSFTERDLVKMTMIDQLYRKLFSWWPAYGFIDVNWLHLEAVAALLIKSDDFEYVLDCRYENFKKYRIDALDSANGKVLIHGDDLAAIIGRNLDVVHKNLVSTGTKQETITQLFDQWGKFVSMNSHLDQS